MIHVSFVLQVGFFQVFHLLLGALVPLFKAFNVFDCDFWKQESPVVNPVTFLYGMEREKISYTLRKGKKGFHT